MSPISRIACACLSAIVLTGCGGGSSTPAPATATAPVIAGATGVNVTDNPNLVINNPFAELGLNAQVDTDIGTVGVTAGSRGYPVTLAGKHKITGKSFAQRYCIPLQAKANALTAFFERKSEDPVWHETAPEGVHVAYVCHGSVSSVPTGVITNPRPEAETDARIIEGTRDGGTFKLTFSDGNDCKIVRRILEEAEDTMGGPLTVELEVSGKIVRISVLLPTHEADPNSACN